MISDDDDIDVIVPWVAPALTNGWVNYGGGYSAAGYRKVDDMIQLRGLVANGALNFPAFTLPVGFRPPGIAAFAAYAFGGFGGFYITTAGLVVPQTGSTGNFSFEGCTFTITP